LPNKNVTKPKVPSAQGPRAKEPKCLNKSAQQTKIAQ
jgi:hypothetical protein